MKGGQHREKGGMKYAEESHTHSRQKDTDLWLVLKTKTEQPKGTTIILLLLWPGSPWHQPLRPSTAIWSGIQESVSSFVSGSVL